ncbi:MAG: DUF1365 domain-containing protein [Pseudomonadota bacterium]
MTAEAPAERPALTLYRGHVMHMRLAPKRHKFRYAVFSLLVDLDRAEAAIAPLRLLRWGRRGILSFTPADHGRRDGSPLRPWAEEILAREGLPRPARIELLAFPRMWGFVFNPLSVYFCYDEAGALESLIYEVKNTFGDQMTYALPAGEVVGGAYRQEQDKAFFVSPFIEMAERYRFTVQAPDARLSLRIRQAGRKGETLIATHTAVAQPCTDRRLARAILSHPLMTLKVIAAIHWHALRLFLLGVRFIRYPSGGPVEEDRLKLPSAEALDPAPVRSPGAT